MVKMNERINLRPWIAWAVLLLALGCGDGGEGPESVVIARIDDQRFTVADFNRYTEANLLEGDEEQSDAAEGSSDEDSLRVRSRLFDTFVEERLLLAEAQAREIEIDEVELERYLGIVPGPSRAEEVRRRLMIELLQEQAFEAQPEPTAEEIEAYLKQHRDRLIAPQRVELRALMLSSMEEATKVHRDLRKRRITFDEAVARHEATPGQSEPTRVGWDALPEPVREALQGVKRGRISKPLELNGDVYIFRVESPLHDDSEDETLALALAGQELQAVRRKQAFEQLLQEARDARRVRLRTERLPFRYLPEDPSTDAGS